MNTVKIIPVGFEVYRDTEQLAGLKNLSRCPLFIMFWVSERCGPWPGVRIVVAEDLRRVKLFWTTALINT